MEPGFCKRKADECLASAQKIQDFNAKRVLLRIAEWWTFLSNPSARMPTSITSDQELRNKAQVASVFFPLRSTTQRRSS